MQKSIGILLVFLSLAIILVAGCTSTGPAKANTGGNPNTTNYLCDCARNSDTCGCQ